MTQIFISYSRVDLAFTEQLYRRLQQMRPNVRIWYDKAPHGLLGGDSWWDEIMNAIAACDVFIYILSNESVQSAYCQAEFTEARRLQKRIITIQARDRTALPGELGDIQYIDMKHGVDDPEALAQLSGALDRQLSLSKRRRPLWPQRTAKPVDEAVPTPDITSTRPVSAEKPWWRNPVFLIGAVLVPIIAAIIQNPAVLRGEPTPTLAPQQTPVSSPVPAEDHTPTPNMGTVENATSYDFAQVPAGEFQGTEHEGFRIMVYEVTNAQFAAFMNTHGNESGEGQAWLDEAAPDVRIHRSGGEWRVEPGYENHPVVHVFWYGARDFCEKMIIDARLPTASMWQQAASWNPETHEVSLYPWGHTPPDPTLANYESADTSPVDAYPAGRSAIGVYNMSGNAAEWVADARGTNRYLYGGGWTSDANEIRVDAVETKSHIVTTASAGFRCMITD